MVRGARLADFFNGIRQFLSFAGLLYCSQRIRANLRGRSDNVRELHIDCPPA
jgi:hypothetical protein